MYPILFNYKIITIGSYGLLLGTAFYIAFLIAEREYKIKSIDPELAYKLLIAVIPSAIIGAKIFHILENLDEFKAAPFEMIFSGAGLSVYGGFILSFIIAIAIIKKNKESVLKVFDASSPAMAIGYAIGRLGCHASGDGCYGIATESIFGVAYPNGIVPVSINVFPTPLFESFFAFIFFMVLLKLRKNNLKEGTLFFIYLLLNGVARFAVEFIRLNPKTALLLTQAQLVAICFILIGLVGLFVIRSRASVEKNG
ncbi:MAG: Prolipoprotein diacylglyceryl transferase [Spirochaetes bacterium ADurb.Bin218]|jgi:phosphatidylglycerol:prolipoprotein diacylglycerol transferase|nr:MAG: Prolipoprotein diacylglyceryl transferase [Spirochaetes bacterium ADurb.Bin218]HOV07744.1 prolipoprotein diacylglyceryl transferase [Spirochaetota bacterium]HPX92442.1 prolipoprotein diacylglyceryl transferase [Spirochaetota bacterium]